MVWQKYGYRIWHLHHFNERRSCSMTTLYLPMSLYDEYIFFLPHQPDVTDIPALYILQCPYKRGEIERCISLGVLKVWDWAHETIPDKNCRQQVNWNSWERARLYWIRFRDLRRRVLRTISGFEVILNSNFFWKCSNQLFNHSNDFFFG